MLSGDRLKGGQMARIARIMVPTDFSAPADAALDYARDLARLFGASIDLVHVFDDPFASGAFVGDGTVMMPAEVRESLENHAREQLATRQAAHAGALPGSSTALLTGPPAKRIVERAKENGADLIVIGTHVLLGSVAERVVRTAGCPVLTTRQSSGK
jgi:nucleotide-binding universal stress UspA family protein